MRLTSYTPSLLGRFGIPVADVRRLSQLLAVILVISCAGRAVAQPTSVNDQFQSLLTEFKEEGGARLYAKRFLRLYEQNRDDPDAVKALTWIVQNVKGRPETAQALRLLHEHHLHSPELAKSVPHIAQSRSSRAHAVLTSLIDRAPDVNVRADACRHLASLLDAESVITDQLAAQPDMKPRVVQYYGKDYGQYLSEIDRRSLRNRREATYEQMLKTFPKVSVGDVTMGDLARDRLFAIRHLSVGCVAPDIEGEDIAGAKFRLSDFRGKVVMITFWGHW